MSTIYDYHFVFNVRDGGNFTAMEADIQAMTMDEAVYLLKKECRNFWVMLDQAEPVKNRDYLTKGRKYKAKSEVKSIRRAA